jgi:hypothetical protein
MGVLDEKAAAASINIITIPHPAKAFKHSSRSHHSSRRQSTDVLSTIEDDESSRSTSPTTTLSPDGKSDLNPFSPFYNHSPTRLSLEVQRSESRRREEDAAAAAAAGRGGGSPMTPINTTAAFDDTDLEAGSTPPTSACSLDKSPMHSRASAAAADDKNFHCTVWPSRRAMQLKKKAMRREKARYMVCGWMAGLNKPARVWAKVVLAALLVGAAVGVAIGISKAVGGGVWRNSQATNAPLGNGSTG